MPEENRPLVSVVVNNYNYGRFVGEAISSALAQTYSPIEVIVVDDGSTDNSREVIDGFENQIIGIYKTNGGQGSCMNSGFLRSRGDLVIFLDADDYLVADVIEEAVRKWDGKATKIHYRMDIIDSTGAIIGQDPASDRALPSGNIQAQVLARAHYDTPASSGNIYSRRCLEAILPMPEEPFRRAADSYLYTMAPLYGNILAMERIGAKYRMHGANGFLKKRRFSSPAELAGILQRFDRCVALVEKFAREKGIPSTFSPRYYASPSFTRLLLLRIEGKLDHSTALELLDNIFYAVLRDKTCSARLRLVTLAKSLVIAFAPMAVLWRIYPNTRPAFQTKLQPSGARSLDVETMLPKK
jgi:glycosyltransferase involved in cell wall biosynthesis